MTEGFGKQHWSRQSTRRKLVFAVVTSLLILIGLEGVARVLELIRPPIPKDYDAGFTPDSHIFREMEILNPGYFRIAPAKSWNFVHQIVSGEKGTNTFRVVGIGGSSVYALHDLFLKRGNGWLEKVGPHFEQIELVNGGGTAHGTHRLITVLGELLEFNPDMVFIYSGHNEFLEYKQFQVYQGDAYKVERGLAWSGLVRFIRDSITRMQVNRKRIELNRIVEDHMPIKFDTDATEQFTQEQVDERMQSYRRNLEVMIGMCRDRDIPVVVGTVASNHRFPLLTPGDMKRFEEAKTHYEGGDFTAGLELTRMILRESRWRGQASEVENGIIADVAREQAVPLFDVATAVAEAEPTGVPGETLFDDHCHLNVAGIEILLDTLEPLLIEIATAADH